MTPGKGPAGSVFAWEALSRRRSMVLITSPLAPARFKDRGTNNVLAPLSRLPLHSQQCPDAFFFFFFAHIQLPNGRLVLPLKGGYFYCKVLLTSVKLLTSWLQRMPRTEGRWQISGRESLLSEQPPQAQQNEQPARVQGAKMLQGWGDPARGIPLDCSIQVCKCRVQGKMHECMLCNA